jgi:electron transfer flavoprotein beta subunit
VRLGFPLVTYAVDISEINQQEGYALIVRKTERGKEIIKATLPAVLTAEKEIAEIPFASLPDLIKSLRYQPESWTADEPLAYDEGQIGLKGSPTWVANSGTPEAHEPAETISVEKEGLQGTVEQVLGDMLSNQSVASIWEENK